MRAVVTTDGALHEFESAHLGGSKPYELLAMEDREKPIHEDSGGGAGDGASIPEATYGDRPIGSPELNLDD